MEVQRKMKRFSFSADSSPVIHLAAHCDFALDSFEGRA
jgi:hypothetical protein